MHHRNTQHAKTLLQALLRPRERPKTAENALDFTARLILTEKLKDLPYGAIWAEFCTRNDAGRPFADVDAR